MELKSLFSAVVAELKKFGEGQHLTADQLFYFVLVLGKVSELLHLPWWMVIGLPLASPAHLKAAYVALAGALQKFLDGAKKK